MMHFDKQEGDIVIDLRPVIHVLKIIRPAKWLTFFGGGLLCIMYAFQSMEDGGDIDAVMGACLGIGAMFYAMLCVTKCDDWKP